MSAVNITLQGHQRYVLPSALESDNVTITGSADSVVVNRGTYAMPSGSSLHIVGPSLTGHGTIEALGGSPYPQLELGAVGKDQTVSFVGVDAASLQLDKPAQFLGTIQGQQEEFTGTGPSYLSRDGNVLNALINLPTITGFDLEVSPPYGHLQFTDHVLSIYDGSDQLQAALRITGVDRMVFVGDIGFGNGLVGGVLTDTYPSGNGGPYDIISGGPPVYFHA